MLDCWGSEIEAVRSGVSAGGFCGSVFSLWLIERRLRRVGVIGDLGGVYCSLTFRPLYDGEIGIRDIDTSLLTLRVRVGVVKAACKGV